MKIYCQLFRDYYHWNYINTKIFSSHISNGFRSINPNISLLLCLNHLRKGDEEKIKGLSGGKKTIVNNIIADIWLSWEAKQKQEINPKF